MLYFVLCNYVNMSAVAACVIIKITIVNLTALVLCAFDCASTSCNVCNHRLSNVVFTVIMHALIASKGGL